MGKKIKLSGRVHRVSNFVTIGATYSPIVKGNTLSKAENMTPEAHARRMDGLRKTWAVLERKRRGERILPVRKAIKKRRRERVKLRETIAREAREVQEFARREVDASMQRIRKIINSDESRDSDALTAIGLLFDRAYGRATQTTVNANIDANANENDISTLELDKRIKEALARVESITGRAAKKGPSPEQPADVRKHDRDTGGSTVH